jgi:hypothetical protein
LSGSPEPSNNYQSMIAPQNIESHVKSSFNNDNKEVENSEESLRMRNIILNHQDEIFHTKGQRLSLAIVANFSVSSKRNLEDEGLLKKVADVQSHKNLLAPEPTFNRQSVKQNTFLLQSVMQNSAGSYHIGSKTVNSEKDDEKGINNHKNGNHDEDDRNMLVHAFATRSRSEGSSSVASSGSLQAMVYNLSSGRTIEMKMVGILMLFCITGFVLLLCFCWDNYKSKMNSVYQNLESSHVLQEMVLPFTFLIKNFVTADFKRRNLFTEGSQNTKDIFEYMDLSQPKSKETMREAFNVKFRKASYAAQFLVEQRISLVRIDHSIEAADLIQITDLERAFSIFLNYLIDMDEKDNSRDMDKLERSRYFLLCNSRTFLKSLLDIFPKIDNGVNETIKNITSTSEWVVILFPCFLVLFLVWILYLKYKLKRDTHKLIVASKQFDSRLLDQKVKEVARTLTHLYPSTTHELSSFFQINGTLNNSQSQSHGRASIQPSLQSSNQLPNSQQLQLESAKHPIRNISSSRFGESSDEEHATPSVALSRSKLPAFLLVFIVLLGLCLAVPLTGFLVNRFIISSFETKVAKVVSTLEGIQQFMLSFTAIVSLKEVDYGLALNPTWEEVVSERKLIKQYIDNLYKVLKKNSNPTKILEKEDEFPELLKINSKFYFEDICKGLQATGTNMDFTNRFNGDSCNSILDGVMKRGSKGLVNQIATSMDTWEYWMAKNPSDPADVLTRYIINTDDFLEIQFGLKLMEFLEEQVLDMVIEVLNQYMENFFSQQDVWFISCLLTTLIIWSSVWLLQSRTLSMIYTNTIDILKIIPSDMISTNKILLSRIFELSRKI